MAESTFSFAATTEVTCPGTCPLTYMFFLAVNGTQLSLNGHIHFGKEHASIRITFIRHCEEFVDAVDEYWSIFFCNPYPLVFSYPSDNRYWKNEKNVYTYKEYLVMSPLKSSPVEKLSEECFSFSMKV